jgi:hypothetical protein
MKMRTLERAKISSPDAGTYPDQLDKEGIILDWPLEKCLVVVNGSNASISVPKYDENGNREKMVRLDRLTDIGLSEGKQNGKPVTITGFSTYLTQIVGVPHDDAQVTMVVEDWGRCETC